MNDTMRDFLLGQHTLTVLENDLPEIFERIGIKVNNIPELSAYYAEHYPKWFREMTEYLVDKVESMEKKEGVSDEVMLATLLMFRCYAMEAVLNEVSEALKDLIMGDKDE